MVLVVSGLSDISVVSIVSGFNNFLLISHNAGSQNKMRMQIYLIHFIPLYT